MRTPNRFSVASFLVFASLFLLSTQALAGKGEVAWEAANAEIAQALERGDLTLARDAAERAAKIAENSFGPDHMKTAVAWKKLGDVMRLTGDRTKAADASNRAAELWEVSLGAKHPFASEVYVRSAADRAAGEDWAGAQADLRKALHIQREYYGSNHTVVAETLLMLERVQRAAGQAQEAFRTEAEAAEILFVTLEPAHPRMLEAFERLAAHAVELGNLTAARNSLKRALEKASAAPHPALKPLASANVLNGDLAAQDRDFVAAEASYVRARELLSRLDGEPGSGVLAVLYKLRELYQSNGREEAAARIEAEAREIEGKSRESAAS